MLYYAPQGWTSDDSDAIERLKIQYGTSMCYPLSSMGSHVSVVPNHQVFRNTPLHTRANVAYFGTFGYELDLNKLKEEEIKEVNGARLTEYKKYRPNSEYHEGRGVWVVKADLALPCATQNELLLEDEKHLLRTDALQYARALTCLLLWKQPNICRSTA